MSSTAVAEKQRFRVATYLAELVRRNRPSGEPSPATLDDVPPFAPVSSFVIGDEVIECEVES